MRALLLLLLAAPAAAGQRFVVTGRSLPLHGKAGLWGEYVSLRGPSVDFKGGGGGWELAADRFYAQGSGYVLDGRVFGRDGTNGGGSLAGGLRWGALRAGAEAQLWNLTVTRPAHGQPSDVVTLLLALPVGAEGTLDLGSRWAASASGGLTTFLGGLEYVIGPSIRDTTNRPDPFFVGQAALGFLYKPWSLGLEAGVQQATGSGDNSPYTTSTGRLTWRWR